MKFRCERDVLGEALATAARAAQGRAGSQPVLAGVRLVLEGSRLEISGTDLELTIQRTIDVNGESDGGCVVPGKLTAEAVRTLAPGAVVVDSSGDTVDITSDRSSFTVRPFAVDDFPRLSEPAGAGGDAAGGDVPAGGEPGGAGGQQGRVPARSSPACS